MAPIRRYLRITQYSVLEVRIYLENPSFASSWLLRPRNPVLPRVIEAVRPLVLPKLKEENNRERSKSKNRKKGVKDVVIEDDFEVSIFLTETSTRHSLLTKQKHFHENDKGSLQSNSEKLTGNTNADAIHVNERDGPVDMPFITREDSDENIFALQDIPSAEEHDEDVFDLGTRHRRKRRRFQPIEDGDDADEDGLFVGGGGDDDDDEEPLTKRMKDTALAPEDGNEDKKKMAMNTLYDGFSIYGRVLCLVVKRRDTGKGKGGASGGQAMMEEWITSTQMPIIDEDGS